jgi:tetratricopeptide (TPR) repeat protein
MARTRVPVPAPPASLGPKDAIAVVAVLLLGALAYSNSVRGEFVFDDLGQIVGNRAIEGFGAFLGPSGGQVLPNRYVAYLTFALNHLVGGYDPFGWHLVNVAIHLANAVLVWAFVLLAFRSPRLRSSAIAPASGAVAFASAAIFVAHPLATQAVSYVVQRITSLATLFYLLAAVLYLAWRLSSRARSRIALYAGVLVSALLAVRTKEIAFTLPVALALVEWAFLEGGRRRWLPILPVAAMALLIPLSLVDLGKPASAVLASADESTRVLAPAGRHDYLRTRAVVVARYLGLLAFPVGQVIDHDVAIRRSWLALDVAGCALLLALLFHRIDPARAARDTAVAGGLAASVLAVATWNRNLVWQSEVALWTDAVAKSPGHRRPLRKLGSVLFKEKRIPEAVAVLQRHAVVFPRSAASRVQLGVVLYFAGRPRDAEVSLREAIALEPKDAEALFNLSYFLVQTGRTPEARPYLTRLLEVEEDPAKRAWAEAELAR